MEELSNEPDDAHVKWVIFTQGVKSYRDYHKQTRVAGLGAAFYLSKLYLSLKEEDILTSMSHAEKANYFAGRIAGAADSGYFGPEESNGLSEKGGRRPNNENEKIKTKVLELLERQVALGKKGFNREKIFDLIMEDLINFLNEQKIERPKATTIQRNTALWAKKDQFFGDRIEELIKKLKA